MYTQHTCITGLVSNDRMNNERTNKRNTLLSIDTIFILQNWWEANQRNGLLLIISHETLNLECCTTGSTVPYIVEWSIDSYEKKTSEMTGLEIFNLRVYIDIYRVSLGITRMAIVDMILTSYNKRRWRGGGFMADGEWMTCITFPIKLFVSTVDGVNHIY